MRCRGCGRPGPPQNRGHESKTLHPCRGHGPVARAADPRARAGHRNPPWPEALPAARRGTRSLVWPVAPPAGPGPAAGRADRHSLRCAASAGPQPQARPGAVFCRRAGAERDGTGRHRQPPAGALGQPARHRADRPARHRPERAAAVQGTAAERSDGRGHRPGTPDLASAGLPGRSAKAAPWRSAPLHHLGGDARRRRRAPGPGRSAGEPGRWLLRHACGAGLLAPVSAGRAAGGDRRRGATRHGAAGFLFHRQPGRAGRHAGGLRSRRHLPPTPPRAACRLASHAGQPTA